MCEMRACVSMTLGPENQPSDATGVNQSCSHVGDVATARHPEMFP